LSTFDKNNTMKLKFKTSNATDFKTEIIKIIEDEKYLQHIRQWGEKGVIRLTPDDTNEYLHYIS